MTSARSSAPAHAATLPIEITEILKVADALTDLLNRESDLVRSMRIEEIAPLQPEKVQLTGRYQSLLQRLGGPANEKSVLPLPIKSVLVDAGRRLADAAVANQQALRIGQVATDRLIGSIVTAIKQQRPTTAGYTPRKVAPRATGRSIAGVTVDRRM